MDILPGITRKVVLQLVQNEFHVVFQDIVMEEVQDLEEVFITASNKEIVPITQIDDVTIGNGKPGKRTQKVMQLFREYTTKFGRGEV